MLTSFRFPGAGDEISSYSRWNWRVLGSLMLDLTFHGDFNIPGLNVNDTEEDSEGLLEEAEAVDSNTTNR